MGIFGKLFGSNKLTMIDADFGEIESLSVRGSDVAWQVKTSFFNTDTETLIEGDKGGIFDYQKKILLNALQNEAEIISESADALKEQYENADMEFISIENHFDLKGISVNDAGFEIMFQQKEGEYYYFNVLFENNKQVGVSIDG